MMNITITKNSVTIYTSILSSGMFFVSGACLCKNCCHGVARVSLCGCQDVLSGCLTFYFYRNQVLWSNCLKWTTNKPPKYNHIFRILVGTNVITEKKGPTLYGLNYYVVTFKWIIWYNALIVYIHVFTLYLHFFKYLHVIKSVIIL